MTKLTDNNDKKRLSDVIDFEKDIAPYNLIQLVAGVGAGKNYWMCKLAEQGYRILLITSRTATAQAQAKKMEADRWFDFNNLFNPQEIWGEIPTQQKKVICTNYQIELFVKKYYNPENPKTHIWNYFDFIVLDEAHSLSADATFADSPFYVEHFLKYAHKHNPKCKIIVMTGTPEPIDWLFEKSEKLVHKLNYFDECVHVEPPKVLLCPVSKVINALLSYYKKNRRVIFFINSTKTIKALVDELQKNGVPENAIGIGYSKKEADELFSENMVTKKENTRKYLVENEKLPEEIKIFITTSQNKEGINIDDTDIYAVIAESHVHADLTQMIGRVRNGVEEFCIIYDAFQHGSQEGFLMEYVKGDSAAIVANSATTFIKKYGNNKKNQKIKEIENWHRDVRYDNLNEMFFAYKGRIEGEQKARFDKSNFTHYIECWDEPCNEYGEFGWQELQKWFPYSDIFMIPDDEAKNGSVKLQNEIDAFLQDNEVLNRVINHDEYDAILDAINSIIESYPKKQRPKRMKFPMKNLGSLLKIFGYHVNPRKNGETFIITEINYGEE